MTQVNYKLKKWTDVKHLNIQTHCIEVNIDLSKPITQLDDVIYNSTNSIIRVPIKYMLYYKLNNLSRTHIEIKLNSYILLRNQINPKENYFYYLNSEFMFIEAPKFKTIDLSNHWVNTFFSTMVYCNSESPAIYKTHDLKWERMEQCYGEMTFDYVETILKEMRTMRIEMDEMKKMITDIWCAPGNVGSLIGKASYESNNNQLKRLSATDDNTNCIDNNDNNKRQKI